MFFREPGESYADVACRAGADVVVEDDCESIGDAQMIASALGPRAAAVYCVVVPEFGGLGHLPDDTDELPGS